MSTCVCPKCSRAGKSVAAMNYSETQIWNKSGSFSGGGIGVGTGGIGVGVGGGTYSESGTSSTKRAATFQEPSPFQSSSLPIVMGLLIVFGVIMLPHAMSFLEQIAPPPSNSSNSQGLTESFDTIKSILIAIVPFIAGFFIFSAIKNQRQHEEQVATLNNTEYPRQLARYNELRYCGNCHILFDEKGNKEDANPVGFQKMMSM